MDPIPDSTSASPRPDPRGQRSEAYLSIRGATRALAAPLSAEDCAIQSMPDASPVKWHLAHTTWFFETFVLVPHQPGYRAFAPEYRVLFNSYYNSVGDRYPRPERGLLSRPGLEEVFAYRRHVDEAVLGLLAAGSGASPKPNDEVTVNYRGTLINGTEFDSSYKRGQPANFQVNRVIPGWTEVLGLMKPGAKWQLFIPPQLAYDLRSAPPIPPGSALIFEVELVSVKAAPPAAPQPAAPAQPATPPPAQPAK